jgi:hypothetical protein
LRRRWNQFSFWWHWKSISTAAREIGSKCKCIAACRRWRGWCTSGDIQWTVFCLEIKFHAADAIIQRMLQ